MSWRVTIRTVSNAPHGQRHLKPPAESFDVSDLAELGPHMARFDIGEIVYVMAVPIGGVLQQWREVIAKGGGDG